MRGFSRIAWLSAARPKRALANIGAAPVTRPTRPHVAQELLMENEA